MPDVLGFWRRQQGSQHATVRAKTIDDALEQVRVAALAEDLDLNLHNLSFTLGWCAHEVDETSTWADTVAADVQLELFPKEADMN